jgi:hypothetical protein
MERNIINNEEYKLKIRKSWLSVTEQWHIEFINDGEMTTRFEIFLTDFELQKFKDAL